jgi:alpha-beta hydrolase superfamily lysophospholipase
MIKFDFIRYNRPMRLVLIKKLVSKVSFVFCSLGLLQSCASIEQRRPQSVELNPWVLDEGDNRLAYASAVPLVDTVPLRAGYYRESADAQFQGCLLYLQGLADSLKNHAPYFAHLSRAGYRVIAFDYMGQGGSGGTMNHTRIVDPLFPALQISSIADQVWNKYSSMRDEITGQDCRQSKRVVIGWSTGGLAAYELAHQGWAEAVILIAPGLYPKKLVGESADRPELLLTGDPVITERTLTSASYADGQNPHVDAIKPDSPSKVPLFATNLLASAKLSRHWKIRNSVKGLVFISGPLDSYIDRKATLLKIRDNARHFKVVAFSDALHEIDNERPEITSKMYEESTAFFESLRSPANP